MATTKKSDAAPSAAAVFKTIDNKLNDPGGGCSTALDRLEQMSWILFLHYLDEQEKEREAEAELSGEPYVPILPKKLRWSSWAWPTKPNGAFDLDQTLKGDELLEFVKGTLFKGLKELHDTAAPDSEAYKVGEIFSELTCRFQSGYTLREVINLIEPLKFQTDEDRHELTVLYEDRLNDMGNAGRNGGQYYTPRPLIRVMIRILKPKLGEKFCDRFCGSAGFCCEAFLYMRDHAKSDAKSWDILQHESIYGGEVKSLAYMTAVMNCILHGLRTPNIRLGDSLAQKLDNLTDADRFDVMGENPPFGASVDPATQQNFICRSSESALLATEHTISVLKNGGRAAIILKNTVLSNTDNGSIYIRKLLLEKCQLEWILDLPPKVFSAGVKAVVLFFKKGGKTTKPIHYYELDLKGVSLGKTRPLRESDLAEFEQLVAAVSLKPPYHADGGVADDGVADGGSSDGRAGSMSPPDSPQCKSHWTIDPASVDKTTYDLSVRNPNIEEEKLPSSTECLKRLNALNLGIAELLAKFTEKN